MSRTARSRLPAQVIDFLEEFVQSGDGKTAAINVGVHPKRADSFVRETMDHPDAREAYDQILRTRFSHARPIALNLLIEMVQDPKGMFTGPVRLGAAQTLVKLGDQAELKPTGRKDLNEMSRDELLQIVNAGESELASRAKMVTNASIGEAIDLQVVDLES
jgi:hypothetical protein